MGRTAPSRPLGRRRRRLYWTATILVVAVLIGGATGWAIYRKSRPEVYRTGEDHAAITRQLEHRLPPEAPEPRFVDVTSESGLAEFRTFAGDRTSQLPEDMGSGAAWGDVDDDGDDDLFLVAAGGPMDAAPESWARSRLYLNDGFGRFDESDRFPETRILGMGAAWGDVDGDGRLDLVLSGVNALRLYRNRGGGRLVRDPDFPEPPGYWSGLSWADFDGDGDLDLYVCGYVRYSVTAEERRTATIQYGRSVPYTLNPASFEPERNLLLRNRGDGRFDEVAKSFGVDNPNGRSLAGLWHDLDGDGRIDLYVANDISDNALFINRGDRFEDTSHAAWVADYRGAMGLTSGDWNRDGDDDLFVTHWIAQENALYDSLLRDLAGRDADGPDGDVGGLRFMDVADQRGLGQAALQRIGWGAEFVDLDADGWLDLAVANGSTFETADRPPRLRAQPPFIFWNRRGEHFHDLAPALPVLNQPRVGRGLATADADRDGDVDLLLVDRGAGVVLLRNEMQAGHAIQIRLRGAKGGTAPAVGARVEALVGETILRKAVNSVSYLSQSSSTLHLGLGAATQVDRLEVIWPDGQRQAHERLAADRIWTIRKGADAAEPRVVRDERATVADFWTAQRAAMQAFKVDRDPQTAIPAFEEALRIDPAHGDSLYYLANCLAETGDVAGALARLRQLIEADPMTHRGHKRWGVLRAATSRDDDELARAQAALERAIEINPEETGARHALGEVVLLRGDTEDARGHFEHEVRTNPQSRAGWFLLAYTTWRSGQVDESVRLLERARDAAKEAWLPEGAVAEGDVRQAMHTETAPLERWTGAWDGGIDPAVAFSALDAELRR